MPSKDICKEGGKEMKNAIHLSSDLMQNDENRDDDIE